MDLRSGNHSTTLLRVAKRNKNYISIIIDGYLLADAYTTKPDEVKENFKAVLRSTHFNLLAVIKTGIIWLELNDIA